MRSPKILKHLLYISLLIFAACSVSFATDFETGDQVVISNIHNIDGDLYVWAERATVNGEIKGDLFGGGENFSINGFVENSANIFANEFSHAGEVNGTLRLFVNKGSIDGYVGRSGLFFCGSLDIDKNAEFNDDIHFRGGYINLEGTVHGDVEIHSGEYMDFTNGFRIVNGGVYISGTVDGDVTIYGSNIHIVSPALIKGNLKYISDNQAQIDITSGVTILGTTTWDLPEQTQKESSESFGIHAVKTSAKIFAAFIVGLLLMLLFKKYIHSMIFELQNRMPISAAVGFLAAAVFVVFVIVLLIALILLITGFILSAKGEVSGGTVILIISTLIIPLSSLTLVTIGSMLYCGKIILALLTGYFIMKKMQSNPKYLSKTQLLVGLILLYVLFEIPYLGSLIFFVVSLIGMGAIILGIKNCDKKENKDNSQQAVGI